MGKNSQLNQRLFDGNELRPDVREALLKVVDAFVEDLKDSDVDIKVKDAVIIGSNASFNYTPHSDIDLHIIADSSKSDYPPELLTLLYSAYRSIFNKNYDINIKGIPCEVYVEMDDVQAMSNGIYSLSKGWVKKPIAQDIPDIDYEAFESLFDEWEGKYFSLLDELGITPEEMLSLNERGEEKESSEKVYDFIEDIYDLRKESIANEGEYGIGNLVFKEFRNLGYLDALKELTKILKGKELSLEAIQEDLDVSKYNTKGKLMKLRNAKGFEGNGTYSQLEDGSIKKEELDSGYMASFFRPEITNKWIDTVLKEIGNRLGAPYFGVFKSLPEISYMFKDKDRAMEFAKLFNQESIWDNSKSPDGEEPNREYNENAKVDYAKALEGLKAFLNGDGGNANEDFPC